MWLRPQGMAEIVSPEKSRANLDQLQCHEIDIGANRFDTMSCNHCNRIIHVAAKTRPEDLGGFCRLCMKPICPTCVDGPCIPFEKKLDMIEARDRARRSYDTWA